MICSLSCLAALAFCLIQTQACSSNCLTCSAPPSHCLSCYPGSFLQPEAVGLCYSYCPTGYAENSAASTCDGTPGVIVNYVLDSITPVIYDKARSWPAQNGDNADYYPPSFESSDPLPIKHRGYHFSGAQYIKVLPLLGAPSLAPVLGTNGSLLVWMFPQMCTKMAMFGKNNPSSWSIDNVLVAMITDSCKLSLVIGSTSLTGSTSLSLHIWHSAFFTFLYDSNTSKTEIRLFLDLVQNAADFLSVDLQDDANGRMSIGQEYDGPQLTDFFKGYIWQVKLYNYVASYTSYQAEVLGQYKPASASFQLSMCEVNQYIEGAGGCVNCQASCDYGCSSALNCYFCDDPLCIDCTTFSSGSCVACAEQASVIGGLCTCNSGFFLNPHSGSCTACHKTCKECVGEAADNCMECKDLASLEGALPCACVCSIGAFRSPDASNCVGCSLTCHTCVGESPMQCTTCHANAVLQGASPSPCVCKENFYPSPDSFLCLPCSPTCVTCANELECLSCKLFAELKLGVCTCISSYFRDPDSSDCQACPEGCLLCLATGCSQCKPFYYTFEGQCLQECFTGYKGTPDYHCVAINLTPVVPSLTVLNDNTLSIFFDKSMNCTVLSTDINIIVEVPGDKDISFTWKEPRFSESQTLLIGLVFESEYLPPNSLANLQFIFPDKIIDEFGVHIHTTSLTGTLKPFGTVPANTTAVLLASSAAQQAATTTQGGVSVGAISSIISGNPACLMSLINQIQMIAYISMTKLPIPSEFASSLAALNVGNMLPNPFSKVIVLDDYEAAQPPPTYVSDYGIKTTLFISNAMTLLTTAGLALLSSLPIYLLSKTKLPFVAHYFQRKLPAFRWSVPIQLWLTSYLDLGVFSLLQLSNASNSFSNPVSVLSFAASCFFILAFALTPIAILGFLARNHTLIHNRSDEGFNQRWGALFMQFKGDFRVSNLAYFVIFSLRRFLFALCLVVTSSYLVPLALINTSLSLLVTLTQAFFYSLICRPYVLIMDQIDAIIADLSTFLVHFAASSFLLDLSTTTREMVNTVGVWLVRCTILLNAVMSVCRSILLVVGLVKAYGDRMKLIQAKYSTNITTGPGEREAELEANRNAQIKTRTNQ